ncbi:hypothetical protein ACJX0J_033505, partial [Zea mays]
VIQLINFTLEMNYNKKIIIIIEVNLHKVNMSAMWFALNYGTYIKTHVANVGDADKGTIYIICGKRQKHQAVLYP